MAPLTIVEVCLRLLCAMLVGLVIGTEREYTHRPAGMRTHILVALGACAVMLTGQMIFTQYSAVGATPDPARLGAQVITGVGFLGAGTILREGTSVKGLTTAASLWTVACLGLAAGGGYYAIALAGMVFILITLTILELLQKKIVGNRTTDLQYIATATDVALGLKAINRHAQSCQADIRQMSVENNGDGIYQIRFQAEFEGMRGKKRQQKFFQNLSTDKALTGITSYTDTVPV